MPWQLNLSSYFYIRRSLRKQNEHKRIAHSSVEALEAFVLMQSNADQNALSLTEHPSI